MPKLSASSQKTGDPGLEWIPWMVAALVIAHLLAFIYWIYRLAVERPGVRRKTH